MSPPRSNPLLSSPDRPPLSEEPRSRLPVAVRWALVLALAPLIPGACTDVTRPVADAPEEDPWALGPGIPLPVAFSEVPDSTCDQITTCGIQQIEGTKYCLCEIEDMITAAVEGGAGEPWPPPSIPEPPGYPSTDYWNWPIEPGEGGIEPGPGEGCDPEAIFGCAHFSAEMGCPTDLTRGETGRCILSVEPDTALEGINQWHFNQLDGDLESFSNHQDTIWEGEVVTSGRVTATIVAYGRETEVTTLLGVVSRGWTWAGGGDLTYDGGGLNWPSGATSQGRTCRAEPLGCSTQWVVQPDSLGFEAGSGYSSNEVDDGGPNDGFWYVQSVTADVALASAIHPDLLPDGVERPHGCPPADELNFIDFNESSCAEDDPGWGANWLNWAWGHEDLHAAKAFDFVDENPEFDIRYELEDVVRETEEELDDDVLELVGPSTRCVSLAAALHGSSLSSPPHPAPTFDIWFWNGVVYSEREASEGAWWDDATDFSQWLQAWQDCF